MVTRNCVECLEEIKVEAKKCPRCQAYQRSWERFLRSQLGGSLIGLAVFGLIYFWLLSGIFGGNTIYNPESLLIISNANLSFKDAACGTSVTIIGNLKNNSDEALTDIVFDAELLDSDGNTIDVVNDKVYDLILASGDEKTFKVSGTMTAAKERYSSFTVSVSKAEPDNLW